MHPQAFRQFIRPCYENYTAALFLDGAGDNGSRLDLPYQAGGNSSGLVMSGVLVRRGPLACRDAGVDFLGVRCSGDAAERVR